MNFFRKYLVPGFVFQSITIGGGYGTGRELVEYFLKLGPWQGLGAMLVATLIWSLVLAVTFELARISQTFDYKSFLNKLLGPGWMAYEFVYVVGLILVISVLGSAAGDLVHDMYGVHNLVGIIGMMIAVGILAFAGGVWIERVLSFWSIALYVVYIILLILFFYRYSDAMYAAFGSPSEGGNWFLSGMKYAAYNVGIVPAILFIARHFDNRKEATVAGVLAGFIAMIPALFIYMSMLTEYPAILPENVPTDFLLTKLNMPAFQWVFRLILLGTFVETGVGLIHGFNERVSTVLKQRGRQMSGWIRVLVAQLILIVGLFLAKEIGLIDLIDKGYGTLTWGYWIVYLIPVLTLGVYRIIQFERTPK